MKTIVALFDERRTAVRAVRELLAHGIPKDRISFLSLAVEADAGRSHLHLDDDGEPTERSIEAAQAEPVMVGIPDSTAPKGPGVAVGTTLGIGSVLLGVAFLTVPAVGPVLAAGPLLAGLAAQGAAEGTTDLPKRLNQNGMPLADAQRYAQAVRSGGVLVLVTLTEEHVEDAAIILARHAPIEPASLHEPEPMESMEPPARVQTRLQATRPSMPNASRPV